MSPRTNITQRDPETLAQGPNPLAGRAATSAPPAQVGTEKTVCSTESLPCFPSAAWFGSFKEYRDLVLNSCESPANFHHAAFSSAMRSLLCPHMRIQYVGEQVLSDYIVLVGRTGMARKDTARRFVQKLWTETIGKDRAVGYAPGIGSGEKLLDLLADQQALKQFRSGGNEDADDEVVLPGRSLWLTLGEMRTMLNKGQQDFVKATLFPIMNEVWDGNSTVGLPTRTNPFEVQGANLNILAGTTKAWLTDFLIEEQVLGGFFNRFVFYPGEDERDLPNPPPPNATKWNSLVRKLRDVLEFWAKQSRSSLMIHGANTETAWSSWYCDFKNRARSMADLDTALLIRLPDHIMRQAALHASLDCSLEIRIEHLQPALELGRYWEASYLYVWAGGAETLNSRLAQTIRRHLQTGPLTRIQLLRKLGGHRDRVQIDRVQSAMLRLGEVVLRDGRLDLAR